MGIGSYIRTWRHMRLRFGVAAAVSFLMAIFNVAVVIRPRQSLLYRLAWFGPETFLFVLLVAWIQWFSCPRCGRRFSFSWKRFRMFSCVHCGLPLGTVQDSSDPN